MHFLHIYRRTNHVALRERIIRCVFRFCGLGFFHMLIYASAEICVSCCAELVGCWKLQSPYLHSLFIYFWLTLGPSESINLSLCRSELNLHVETSLPFFFSLECFIILTYCSASIQLTCNKELPYIIAF